MKNLFILCSVIYFAALTHKLSGQHHYSFSKSSGNAYSDLVGDVNITSFDTATGLFFVPDFQGETFKFYDVPFTFGGLKSITIGSGPFLRIDNDTSLIV